MPEKLADQFYERQTPRNSKRKQRKHTKLKLKCQKNYQISYMKGRWEEFQI